jgi:hypothetical protein
VTRIVDKHDVTTIAAPTFEPLEIRRTSNVLSLRLLVIACVLTALAGRLVFLVQTFNPDSATFIYLGKSVCDGDRFCHDIIDNKFPTVGLMTSICWRAFGMSWPAYVLLQTTLSILASLLLARAAARTIGEHARVPTALGAMVYLNFTLAVFGGFQLETLQIFFSILAACSALDCLMRRSPPDAFVVGLAAGCAAMIKPSGLAVVGAFAVASLINRSWRDALLHAAAAALGLWIPAAVTLAYLVSFDILRDMPALFRQISDYASHTPIAWEDICRPITVIVLAGFGIVVRGWVQRRSAHRVDAPISRGIVVFAVTWFILELAGAVLQRRMYAYHFLPVAAPTALLFGILPRKTSARGLLAALAPIMAFSLMGSLEILKNPEPQQSTTVMSNYLLSHASPGDAVWADLSPRVLLETNLRPGARFPIMFVFGNTDTAPLEDLPILLSDFEHRRPKYIILPADVEAKIKLETTESAHLARSPARAANFAYAWREVEAYVKSRYTPEVTLRREALYKREGE